MGGRLLCVNLCINQLLRNENQWTYQFPPWCLLACSCCDIQQFMYYFHPILCFQAPSCGTKSVLDSCRSECLCHQLLATKFLHTHHILIKLPACITISNICLHTGLTGPARDIWTTGSDEPPHDDVEVVPPASSPNYEWNVCLDSIHLLVPEHNAFTYNYVLKKKCYERGYFKNNPLSNSALTCKEKAFGCCSSEWTLL